MNKHRAKCTYICWYIYRDTWECTCVFKLKPDVAILVDVDLMLSFAFQLQVNQKLSGNTLKFKDTLRKTKTKTVTFKS